ncbi:hypothetical protein, partial [Rhodovulum sulfidophilum]|uniref:hypothetical protein n=1 Tax=Rhodovulum sulfidophilum TaxID=35806 RepID=UPI001F227088
LFLTLADSSPLWGGNFKVSAQLAQTRRICSSRLGGARPEAISRDENAGDLANPVTPAAG